MKQTILNRFWAGLFGLALVLFSATTPAHAADEFVADELLVAFQPGIRGARADGIRNGLGAARIKAWPQIKAEHWRLPPGLGVAQAIQALSANPNVLYAEPNYLVHAVAVPNDPRPPAVTSGIRMGSAAVTTRGLGEAEFTRLGSWMDEALRHRGDPSALARIRGQVEELCAAFPLYTNRNQ